MTRVFISATGTGAGKTTTTCALARRLVRRGLRVAALKPLETGVVERAEDALALATACGQPALAGDPAWYRAPLPVSPYAATLAGHPAPDLGAIEDAVRAHATCADLTLVEGAGGLLVPVDRERTIADLARALDAPLLLVAPDRLGVLSDTLATVEAAVRRRLTILALVLGQTDDAPDPSRATNARILSERLDFPVFCAPFSPAPTTPDDALDASGLVDLVAGVVGR